jgi:predicted nicotinamide N-methyase
MTPEPSDKLLRSFFSEHARLEYDTLCGEITLWQTDDLHAVWNKALHTHAGAAVPYWAIAWPGGRALARHLLDHPRLCRNRKVLDLGTGSGITAIAAALCGGRVTGLDNDCRALDVAAVNAAENGVSIAWQLYDLCAGDGTMLDSLVSAYQVVLAGDIFNCENFAGRATLALRLAAERGATVLGADAGRSFRPRDNVRVLDTVKVPVNQKIEGIRERMVQIFSIS